MNDKGLAKLKEQYFGAASKRTGTPLKYYELPSEVVAKYEQEKEQARLQSEREKEQAKQRKKADRAKLNPTRGEVSFTRRVRREVGD